MAGTMTMRKVEFTRASLIGKTYRIGVVYGASPLGIRVYLAYHAAFGCRDGVMRVALERCELDGVAPLASSTGRPCSTSWYDRQELTQRVRERRELEARRERGERFDMFTRAQA